MSTKNSHMPYYVFVNITAGTTDVVLFQGVHFFLFLIKLLYLIPTRVQPAFQCTKDHYFG